MDQAVLGTSFCKISGHAKEVSSCAFNGDFLVTSSGDKSVRVHSLKDFSEKSYSPLLAHKYAVNCVTFDKTGKLLASASTDGTAIIWSLRDNEAVNLKVFRHSDSNTVQACDFSPNSSMLVTGSSDGGIGVWSIDTYQKMFQFIGHPEGNVNAAAFTPCNDYLVTGSAVGDIRVWDLRYNEYCILQTQAHDKGVSGYGVDCICFSPTFHVIGEDQATDSYLMASCGQDNHVKLWLFQRSIALQAARKKDHLSRCLQPLHELSGHHGPVSECCFSPDGLNLASSSFDKSVIIWNPITAEQLLVLDGHSAIVTCVTFSPDGKYLASTSYDKTTIVWKLVADTGLLNGQSQTTSEISPVANLVDLSLNDQPSSNTQTCSAPVLDVFQWTSDEVVKWLEEELKLTQYSTSFKTNEIDGDELVNLTSETLLQELGVTPLGHRNKILRGVKALKERPLTKMQRDMQPNAAIPAGNPVFVQAGTASSSSLSATFPTVRATPRSTMDDSSIPDEFLCPISREVMKDPVLAADGFSYERKEIESWFKRGSAMSPMTNKVLSSRTLVPNQALKTIIIQYLEAHTKS